MIEGLTPKQIVEKLDNYIIGQNDAKKAVAVALRNRMRRQSLIKEMQDEITPKNILMIGPTGVGKTEIARRLAKLVNAPFLKVEASKFTEVGYVGRDVESMIRDLVQISVSMVKEEQMEVVKEEAKIFVEEKMLDLLVPPIKDTGPNIMSDEDKEKHEKKQEISGLKHKIKLDIMKNLRKRKLFIQILLENLHLF